MRKYLVGQPLVAGRDHHQIFTNALEVKCVTPAAHMRQNAVLKSITILDIFTDAFRKSWALRSPI